MKEWQPKQGATGYIFQKATRIDAKEALDLMAVLKQGKQGHDQASIKHRQRVVGSAASPPPAGRATINGRGDSWPV